MSTKIQKMDKKKKKTEEAPKNVLETEEETPKMEEDLESKSGKIEVGDPIDLKPKSLPLVCKGSGFRIFSTEGIRKSPERLRVQESR